MTIELRRFADAPSAACGLAQAVAADLTRALGAPGELHDSPDSRALLLVSGGRSPLPFFEALTALPLAWNRIDLSLVDDRSVPHDHADSNAALVAAHLLRGDAARARWLPLITFEQEAIADPWQRAEAAARAANHAPALARPAAIVLGMGADGHTASLFADAPQYEAACRTAERYAALQPGSAPHARVGLSLQALIAQRSCYLWSGGSEKMVTLETLQALVEQVRAGLASQAALVQAGPLAQLIAEPTLTLRVFHSDQ